MDDAEFDSILTAAREGAPWAWNRLYHYFSPRLLGYLRSRGASEPEDLLGEVWIQIARGLAGFTGDLGGFSSWIFMIGHHRLFDEFRKRQRRPALEDADRLEVLESRQSDRGEFDEFDELDRLVALLAELPDIQQSVILLRVVADLSVAQTAQVLDTTETAVKSAQYRAVQRLREILSQSATNPGDPSVTEM